MSYLTKAKQMYASYFEEEAAPCTEEEVAYFERTLTVKLPAAFREYLLWMGNGADIYVGSDFYYRPLFDLQEGVDGIFERNLDHPNLPEDAIVFFMHGGNRFIFIRASEGEDPPIYFYAEGMTEFAQTCPHFSRYLEVHIQQEIRMKQELEQLRKRRWEREQKKSHE